MEKLKAGRFLFDKSSFTAHRGDTATGHGPPARGAAVLGGWHRTPRAPAQPDAAGLSPFAQRGKVWEVQIVLSFP